MAKKESQGFSGDEVFTEPTGIREVREKGVTLYRYVFGKGEGRMVNTNKCCKNCPRRGDCYVGQHAALVACPERRDK